ncbi:Carabin [Vanrija pseudolonga]|uniref:Carabin n=1 Tax=Vanrija pseudolonga TaxID=143232 RepID=A0AAF0Y8A7_9TREE|nr:Carabin [Vanrija pseudolonga]
MRRLENREINDLHAQAERGGLGQATALVDCVAEGPDQLMFMEGDTLVVLRDLGDELLAFCEGEVGWVKRENISFDNLASTSSAPSSPKSSTCLATPSDLSATSGLVPQSLLLEDHDFAHGTTLPLVPKAKPPTAGDASESPKLDSSTDHPIPPPAPLLDQAAAPTLPTPNASSQEQAPPSSDAQNSSDHHSRTASDASSATGSSVSYIGPLVIGGLGPRLQHAQDDSDNIDDDPSTHTFGRFTGLGAFSAQSPFRTGANAPVQTVAGRIGVSTISPAQRQSMTVEQSRLSQLRFSDLHVDGSVLQGVLQEDEEAEEQLQDPLPGRARSKPEALNLRMGLPATIAEDAETPRATESPKPPPPQALLPTDLPAVSAVEDAGTLTTPTSATKDFLSLPAFPEPHLTPRPLQAEPQRAQVDPSVTGLPVSDSPKSATAFSFRLAYDDPDTDSESATNIAPPLIKATSPLAADPGASLLTPLQIPDQPLHPGLTPSPSIVDSSSSLQTGSPDSRVDAATQQFYGLGYAPHVASGPVASSPISEASDRSLDASRSPQRNGEAGARRRGMIVGGPGAQRPPFGGPLPQPSFGPSLQHQPHTAFNGIAPGDMIPTQSRWSPSTETPRRGTVPNSKGLPPSHPAQRFATTGEVFPTASSSNGHGSPTSNPPKPYGGQYLPTRQASLTMSSNSHSSHQSHSGGSHLSAAQQYANSQLSAAQQFAKMARNASNSKSPSPPPGVPSRSPLSAGSTDSHEATAPFAGAPRARSRSFSSTISKAVQRHGSGGGSSGQTVRKASMPVPSLTGQLDPRQPLNRSNYQTNAPPPHFQAMPPSAYLQQQAPWQNDLNRHAADKSHHAAKESQSDHGSVQSVHHVPLGKHGEPVMPHFARGHSHSSSTASSPPRQGRAPLHPPVSYRDFADPTVSADGIEFEIIQPRKPSNGPPAIRLSLESAGLGILSGSERESLDSGNHAQSMETDEWGFLKRSTPTPAIFQSRVPPAEVRAAEQKWLDIITKPLHHGQQAPKKVRRMVIEQGIPASLRGKVWGWLMSNGQSGRVNFLFQTLLTDETTAFDEQISKDVSQVYKDHSAFVGPKSTGQQDLRTLLRAFMNFAPDGYRTEIAQIGGALLIHAVVEDAFWLLAGLFNGVLKTYYVKDRGAFSVDLHVFAGILQGSEPKIAKLFRDLGIAPHHYLEQWWTALFIRSLPWPTVLRFLDAVISEGPRYILIGSLSVLTLSRERLLALPKTPQVVLGYLRNLPQDSLLLPDTFMRACEEVKLRDDDLKKLRASVKEQLMLSGGGHGGV